MLKAPDFIPTLQRKLAVTAVGPSALRGQGRGVLRATQEFLAHLDLSRIPVSDPTRFRRWLDGRTETLLSNLPIKNRPWGAARKALNLFLRDVLYNRYMGKHCGAWKVEKWLEVPLDSIVARKLKQAAGRGALPGWIGLKNLTPSVSDKFQDFAAALAQRRHMQRVHLDMYLWLSNKQDVERIGASRLEEA